MSGRSNDPQKSRAASAVIAAAIGAVIFLSGLIMHIKVSGLERSCTKIAAGVVTHIEKKTDQFHGGVRFGGEMYRATLMLTDDEGTELKSATTPWSTEIYQKDMPIAVKYDPADPERIYVPSHPADDGSIRFVFGGAFIGLGAVLFAVSKIKG